MKKSTILIATTNQGKYTEICEFLADLPFNFISLSDLKKIPAEPEEIGETIAENAILKARYYGQKTKLLTLADDTGLFVSALKGWPGVNSARVAATDQGKMDLLLKKMVIIPEEKRTATFRSAIAFCDSINNRLHLVIGELPGKIMLTPSKKRNLGYGYDPIFFVNEKNKPYSEMGLIEKNGCSHRGRALLQMKYFLQNNYDAKQCVAPIALIIKGGKIYLQKRHDPFNPEFHDKWEFPGGGIDMGETVLGNLKREVKEETGFDIEPIKLLQHIPTESRELPNFKYQLFLLPYVCKIIGGKNKLPLSECSEARWFSLDELKNFNLIGTNYKMYKKILPELKEIIFNHKM